MKINIKYFGLLVELIGKNEETLLLSDVCTVTTLINSLVEHYPQLESKQFKVAVNQCLAAKDVLISEQDEVALLPPFAGG